MKNEKVPLSWVLGKMAYDSTKFIKGGIFAIATLYIIGATYIIYKGSDKYVRTNRTDVDSTN